MFINVNPFVSDQIVQVIHSIQTPKISDHRFIFRKLVLISASGNI